MATVPQDGQDDNRGLGSSKARLIVAAAVIAAIGIYLGYVVHNESLRRDYFVQRLTTGILVLGVVVVLFTLFKNFARVQLPVLTNAVPPVAQGTVITLAGAAALFWILLGPVKNLIFPPDQVFSGNIYYKLAQPGDPLEAVKGVVVQIPETDQKSQPSSEDGRFTITSLTFHPEEVNAMYSGLTYPFEPAKYQHSRYDVIQRPSLPPTSRMTSIAPTEWTESGNKCTGINTAGYTRVALFVLQKSLPTLPGYSTMSIKVNVQSSRIVDAQKEKPDNEGFEDQLSDDRTLAREWSVPVQVSQTEVKLTLCLGTSKGGQPPARNDINTVFWFEK